VVANYYQKTPVVLVDPGIFYFLAFIYQILTAFSIFFVFFIFLIFIFLI